MFTECLKARLPDDLVTYIEGFIPPKLTPELVYHIVLKQCDGASDAIKMRWFKELHNNREKFRAIDTTSSLDELREMALQYLYDARHDVLRFLSLESAKNRRSITICTLCQRLNHLNGKIHSIEFNKYWSLLEELSVVVPLSNFGDVREGFWEQSFVWVLFA